MPEDSLPDVDLPKSLLLLLGTLVRTNGINSWSIYEKNEKNGSNVCLTIKFSSDISSVGLSTPVPQCWESRKYW